MELSEFVVEERVDRFSTGSILGWGSEVGAVVVVVVVAVVACVV
jgi:hypothetical protein